MRAYPHAICLLAVMAAAASAAPQAWAQAPDAAPALSFELTPYLWLPGIDTTFRYPVLGGGTATTTLSAGPGQYLTDLNFATMLAGEVRYERFSLLTDIIYINANTGSSRLRSFQFGSTEIPVDQTVGTATSARLQDTVWTLVGGYRVVEESWGNVDLQGGFRMLATSQTTNFSLSAAITRPDGSVALGRSGTLSGSRSVWNAIGGLRGRIYLGDADWFGGGRFFLPFYADVGTGGSHVTWQVFAGLGYQTERIALSLGYRYLSFNQGSSATVPKLTLGGPIVVASFRF